MRRSSGPLKDRLKDWPNDRQVRRLARLIVVAVTAMLGEIGDAGAQRTSTSPGAAIAAPTRTYRALVASESVDRVAVIEFGPTGARVVREHEVGVMLADPDGPHGLAFEPGGAHYYVTTAHGTPYGVLWKFDTRTNAYQGQVMLGNFPATLQVSPDGRSIVVVNFNLHGDMVPSDVSVVRADSLQEIARITTCTMPHGSRMNSTGTRHYSVCMMDDQLVEIDLDGLQVARHFLLTRGLEQGMAGMPPQRTAAGVGAHAGHDMSGHGLAQPAAGSTTCSPTWAQPSPDDRTVWVACNGTSDLVEIDVPTWQMRRRIPAGNGVYNLAITRDGKKLVATNKRGQSVSVIDTQSGAVLATLPTQRRVVHGVAVTSDDRYAFVSVEGVGSEPGTVEIIDLVALETVARVDVGQQAGGIDVVPDPG
ncbi:YncE family protein [Gemmatimonas aurantiaca]|uniref:YncE family protein n=1 Tax=Gemmatimonas aurantiaca TaxID=173480 RepID=UPI00301D4BA5